MDSMSAKYRVHDQTASALHLSFASAFLILGTQHAGVGTTGPLI
jgi:hypothetical protein